MFVGKRRRLRGLVARLMVPSLVGAMIIASPASASSTTVSFSDFADLSSLVLSGNTATNGNPVIFNGQHVLRLTTGLGQAGGAFLKDPIPLQDASGFKASFSTAFQFQITNPVGCVDTDGVQGADGLVFVVQTTSNQYGGSGVGMGYSGIPKSVGIEFDTWNNGFIDGNNGNHIGVDVNGNINSAARYNVTEGHMNDGGTWNAWVDYNGDTQQLEVRLSKSATRPAAALLTHTVDLPTVLGQPNAYVGFVSGTGCAGGNHDIRSWTFTNTFNPIGACPAGLNWKGALSGSSPYQMPLGSTLPITFQFCDQDGFVHDESVVIVIQDGSYPIAAWVYDYYIEIDDVAMEYRQSFDSGQYWLQPGMTLDVLVYMGDELRGSAQVVTQ